MKKPLLLFILTFIAFGAMALASPETIQPKTKIIRPSAWYADQAESWQQRTQQNPNDAGAWFNYYMASRYAIMSQSQLSDIARAAAKNIPGTFEAKVITGVDGGFTEDGLRLLMEAYRAHPEKLVVYGPLLLAHEWNLDESSRKDFSKKLFSSGNVSQSLLSYSYNVLMSLAQNAVLFVDGDNTTLPLYILQDVMNVRNDVIILNLELLTSKSYRGQKLASVGLAFSDAGDFQNGDKKQLCKLIPEQNSKTKFYYALTVARENVSSINDQLYVVGLASQLSKDRLDNISIIRENLEDRFLMDYLLVDFNGESEFASGRVLSSNYLVPMLLLHEQYVKEGNRDRSQALEILVTKVASSSGKEALVRNILMKDENKVPFFPFALDYKAVDGTMRMVSNTVYAQDHEVTNEEFNTFLRYLTQNKLNDLYEKYKFDLSAYTEPALSFLKGYSAAGNTGKKTKQHFPAVNVSYAAAQAYCEWLTEQYNNSGDRKFKKVKFRLPKFNEWQIAAASIVNPVSWNLDENSAEVKVYPEGKMAGSDFTKKTIKLNDPEVLYPWFRIYAYRNNPANSFSCYLGNFKIPEGYNPCQVRNKTITADGWMAMAPVESYFPNDIGLFDIVGNVAEMLDEEGKAAGGSWNHPPEESTIRSINEYKGPDSAVGFRIFMDLIEK
jgi:formylglycine-generating enzyme required for sulfatase activity